MTDATRETNRDKETFASVNAKYVKLNGPYFNQAISNHKLYYFILITPRKFAQFSNVWSKIQGVSTNNIEVFRDLFADKEIASLLGDFSFSAFQVLLSDRKIENWKTLSLQGALAAVRARRELTREAGNDPLLEPLLVHVTLPRAFPRGLPRHQPLPPLRGGGVELRAAGRRGHRV